MSERQLCVRTITRLKGKYAYIVGKIKLIFEEKNYKINELILKLCATDEENQTIFSADNAFVKITNTTELFFWIGKYCTMYDYELLMTLVESTMCEEAIKLLDDFSNELHSSILKDLDLLSEDGELRDIESFITGTHKLEIKYVGGKCTLTTIENVKRIICEKFHLKKGSIIFQGAQEGCVVIIFQILATVKSRLLQCQISIQDAEKLADGKIRYIKVDDTQIEISPGIKQVCTKCILKLWVVV